MAYIRWQYRYRNRPKFSPWNVVDVHWSAVLVENKRVNGKPTQQHIAYVVGFTESAIKIDCQQCFAWDRVADCLDKLGDRIDNRDQIEAAIAARLGPKPTPKRYKAIARDSAQSIGWEWITEKQRAALQDEADKYQGREGAIARAIRVHRTLSKAR